jgi:hypothetical protein
MNESEEPRKKRERSPSYPAIPLGPAVERAKELYRIEKAYLTPTDTILQHWDYRPRSGSGMVALAALIKFGLLEAEGSGTSRKAKVTDLALRIVRDTREESPDRDRLLKEAALKPQIHGELWERYGGSLPSDSNLEHTLKFEYSFTGLGATELIRELRATLAFAHLDEGDEDLEAGPTSYPEPAASGQIRGSAQRSGEAIRHPGANAGEMVLSLPIPGSDKWPSLHLPARITSADWDQMIAVLQAMKPGIVAREVPKEPEPDQTA